MDLSNLDHLDILRRFQNANESTLTDFSTSLVKALDPNAGCLVQMDTDNYDDDGPSPPTTASKPNPSTTNKNASKNYNTFTSLKLKTTTFEEDELAMSKNEELALESFVSNIKTQQTKTFYPNKPLVAPEGSSHAKFADLSPGNIVLTKFGLGKVEFSKKTYSISERGLKKVVFLKTTKVRLTDMPNTVCYFHDDSDSIIKSFSSNILSR